MASTILLAALLLSAPPSSSGLSVQPARVQPRSAPRRGGVVLLSTAPKPLEGSEAAAARAEEGPPPASGPLEPLPRFSWRTVAFIALNPAALLPLPLVAWCLGMDLLGPAWGFSRLVLLLGLLWALPLFALSLLPLERIPALSALREVSQASETICLYALGHRLVPLRGAPRARRRRRPLPLLPPPPLPLLPPAPTSSASPPPRPGPCMRSAAGGRSALDECLGVRRARVPRRAAGARSRGRRRPLLPPLLPLHCCLPRCLPSARPGAVMTITGGCFRLLERRRSA